MIQPRHLPLWLVAVVSIGCAGYAASPSAETLLGYPAVVRVDPPAALGQSGVQSFAQASNGVLYLGGSVFRTFDGERWAVNAPPALNNIYGLDLAGDHEVWVGGDAEAGRFIQADDGEWTYESLRTHFAPGEELHTQIWGLFTEADGVVFVTSDRVYRWDGKHMRSWQMPGARRLTLHRVEGKIFVGHSPTGIYVMTAAGPELILPQAEIGSPDTGVLAMFKKSDGWLLATSDGFVRVRRGKGTPVKGPASDFIREQRMTSGVALPDGRYAFGSLKGGLLITSAEGGMIEALATAAGVSPHINALFVDRDGSLWMGGPNGVQRADVSGSTRVFDARCGLASCTNIAAAAGLLAIGTDTGVVTLQPDGKHFARIPEPAVAHSLFAAADSILVPGFRSLWRLSPAGRERLAALNFDFSSAIASRVVPGQVLASNFSPDVVAIGPTTFSLVANLPAAASSIAEDDRGNLWLGTTTRGLYVAPRGEKQLCRVPGPETGLPPLEGWVGVRSTSDGSLLVITDGHAWVRPAGAVRFQPVGGFPDRTVAAVSQGSNSSSIWVAAAATENRAAVVGEIPVTANSQWHPRAINDLDLVGEPRAIFPEISGGQATALWIGGTKGLIRHVLSGDATLAAPRAPLLRAYVRDAKGAREPLPPRVPYARAAIEFEFAAPQFGHRAQLRLESRIKGIDTNWVPSGLASGRQLTAVRDGNYTVEVRAVAETGAVSEPAVFAFTVLPPWWRTTWAWWLEALAAVAAIFGSVQWRLRTLRRRNAQLEQKVKERTSELAEANAAKTQFVANISHDIRNPLSGIVGLTVALQDTVLDAQQRELVSTLRECTTYLSTLIDDVLDFASIEAGKIELRPAPYVPAELLNSVVTALKAQCAEKKAFVTIETDPDIPRSLLGDAGRIQQVLVNYLSNALKYGGGHIRVTATLAADSAGEVEYSVADEGPGISDTDQAALFTQFGRLEKARRSHVPGTGLGLASCRVVADAMAGSVGVESQVGQGSRFFLRLPLIAAADPVPIDDTVALPPTSVLLVEDTEYNAIATKAVLAKLGLGCDRAATGAEALELFAAKRHHIVLLDRNLPDMDGTEVAARIRAMETDGLHALVLAVTAYCTSEDRTRCLEAGMDAFVGKPLTPEKLRRVLLTAADQMLGAGNASTPATVEMTSSAAAALPKVDMTLLQYLADGTEGGLALQAERFIDALKQAHEELLRVHGSADLGTTANAAHRVLGHARMVNAQELTEALIAVETAARAGDADHVDRSLPRVNATVNAVTEALRRHPGVLRA